MTSKADLARYHILHSMPCIACLLDGNATVCGRTEAHHLVDKGYRRLSGGNQATIPLGRWHHRGIPREGYTNQLAREIWGPSLASEKRAFIEQYGTERELLARVDAEIRVKSPSEEIAS